MNNTKRHNPLPVIIIAQFFCTSVWFAGNAVLPELTAKLHLPSDLLAYFTIAVQLGFISGTLVFAILSIADRFSPSKVFFVCAVVAAAVNISLTLPGQSVWGVFLFRFLTGIFLAGIYPVGMKIASDYFQQGLGKSLGWLVGALVLGTAFPHFLKTINQGFDWQNIIYGTSALSFLGGSLIYFLVPDGPNRKPAMAFQLSAFMNVFKIKHFRAAAFGYFGHMWELYAFWAFVPVILRIHQEIHPENIFSVSLYSFIIIAVGSVACVISGYFSERFGTKKVASIALSISMLCCLLSPFAILQGSTVLLLTFMIFWGMTVIADSPLFSTLVAQNSPATNRGTALTIVNCLGFALTIISIQFLNLLINRVDPPYSFMLLAIGPAVGLTFLLKK